MSESKKIGDLPACFYFVLSKGLMYCVFTSATSGVFSVFWYEQGRAALRFLECDCQAFQRVSV